MKEKLIIKERNICLKYKLSTNLLVPLTTVKTQSTNISGYFPSCSNYIYEEGK